MLELKANDGGTQVVLRFEHSLLSLSKWEQRNKVPFLTQGEKSPQEMLEYFQDMLLDGSNPDLIYGLDPDSFDALKEYINASLTASSVPDQKSNAVPEVVTSELLYYWMTIHKINWQAETWHLSRLFMLIRIAAYKAQPEKAKSQGEQYKTWQQMNEENQKIYGEEA